MKTYLVTIAVIFIVLGSGIVIDRLYRRFASRNPQLGPFRKSGCGGCSCGSGSCDNPS